MPRVLANALLVVSLLGSGRALAQPETVGLAEGIRQVEAGDLANGLIVLDGVVQRLVGVQGRESDLALAHLNMGIAYHGLGQLPRAENELRKAWRSNKAVAPDPAKTPPGVLRMLEAIRAGIPMEAAEPVDAGATGSRQAAPPPKRGLPAVEDPRAVPKQTPGARRGGGGRTTLLVAGGLALAGAGALLALKKDPLDVDDDKDGVSENQGDCDDRSASVRPNGRLEFSNARFEGTSYNCPRGSNLPDPKVVLFDGVNNSCAAGSVSGISAAVTVVARSGTTNSVGQVLSFGNVAFSPNSIPGVGGRQSFRATISLFCSNFGGVSGAFNDYAGQLTIAASSGTVVISTSNVARTLFP